MLLTKTKLAHYSCCNDWARWCSIHFLCRLQYYRCLIQQALNYTYLVNRKEATTWKRKRKWGAKHPEIHLSYPQWNNCGVVDIFLGKVSFPFKYMKFSYEQVSHTAVSWVLSCNLHYSFRSGTFWSHLVWIQSYVLRTSLSKKTFFLQSCSRERRPGWLFSSVAWSKVLL